MKVARRKPQNTVPRTLKRLRDAGWIAAPCERWIPFARYDDAGDDKRRQPPGVRKDLFGLFDVLAFVSNVGLLGEYPTLGVQCCHASTAAAHMEKMIARPELAGWLCAHRLAELHGWRQLPDKRWTANVWGFTRLTGGEVEATRIE